MSVIPATHLRLVMAECRDAGPTAASVTDWRARPVRPTWLRVVSGMNAVAPGLLSSVRMTRAYSPRPAPRTSARTARPARDASITVLGFTCYRLEWSGGGPNEPDFVPVQMIQTRNAMGAFTLLR